MLVVEAEVEPIKCSNGYKNRVFKCICDCGKYTTEHYSNLIRGTANNCGCTPGLSRCPIDLTGCRFRKLTVVSEVDSIYTLSGIKYRRWRCICDCGNTVIIKQRALTNQYYTGSCGCLPRSIRDPKKALVGNRYGLLTVISASEPRIRKNGKKQYTWLCQCDCGSKTVVCEENLLKGHTKSCGCLVGGIRKYSSSDFLGHRFGMLTVITAIEPYKDKKGKTRRLYICLCDCGQEHVAVECNLINGRTNSCGCLNHLNLINKRFGHLTILSRNKTKPRKLLYNCQCDCGKELVVSFNDLYNSIVTDCGCQGEKYIQDGYDKKDGQNKGDGRNTHDGRNSHVSHNAADSTAQDTHDNTGLSTDLTGQMFGMLTAEQKAPPLISPDRKKSTAWFCRCGCGSQIAVRQERLTGKGAISCGCVGLCF